jgi:hypothetical protein
MREWRGFKTKAPKEVKDRTTKHLARQSQLRRVDLDG